MQLHIRPKLSRRKSPITRRENPLHRATVGAELEFSCFRVLLRRRQLLADRVVVELGTRAFDILMVLLEADGALVTKKELLSRVWPGVVVSEENLRFQVSALRKALGADRDIIRTEFGRGYRFIGVLRVNGATAAPDCAGRERLQSAPILCSSAISGSSPGRGAPGQPPARAGIPGVGREPHSCLRSFRSVNSAARTERCWFSGLNTVRGSTAWP